MDCKIISITIITSVMFLVIGTVGTLALYFDHKERMKDKETKVNKP